MRHVLLKRRDNFSEQTEFLSVEGLIISQKKIEFLLVGEQDNLKERLAVSKRFLVPLFKYCKNMCKLKSIIKKRVIVFKN